MQIYLLLQDGPSDHRLIYGKCLDIYSTEIEMLSYLLLACHNINVRWSCNAHDHQWCLTAQLETILCILFFLFVVPKLYKQTLYYYKRIVQFCIHKISMTFVI